MYRLKKKFKNEKGQGLVEYVLILALVSIVAILVLSTLGGSIKGQLEEITASMGGISEPGQGPGDSDGEIDDLIKNHHFIPVATADELNNVRSATSETYGKGTKWEAEYTGGLDKKYIQVADIDLSGIDNFEPIGTYFSRFTGTFDGGGYVISNLTIDRRTEDFVGLFGSTEGATFKNIGLVNVDVTGRYRTGGLVGSQYVLSTVTDSYATGNVTGESIVGGLVGEQYRSSTTDSYTMGSVTGGSNTGGLVGVQEDSSLTNSYATGSVNGTGEYVGGLVGRQYNPSTVTNSYYDKETTGQSDTGKGTGKTTEEMKNKDTYVDWDFESIWTIESNQYPTLR